MRALLAQSMSALEQGAAAAAGVVVVWFDDLDALLGLGGGALQEEIGESEATLRRRQQIVTWLRSIPAGAPLAVVGAISASAGELRRVVPALLGPGAFERQIRLSSPPLMARTHILQQRLRTVLHRMAREEEEEEEEEPGGVVGQHVNLDSPGNAGDDAASAEHPASLNQLASWGAERTAGYLPGDLVRWCRRAALRTASAVATTTGPSYTRTQITPQGAGQAERVQQQRCCRLRNAMESTLPETLPAPLTQAVEISAPVPSAGVMRDGGWDSIAGYARIKHELRQVLEWPTCHADAWNALGLPRPRGVLLHGPSGCGKTTLARGIASALPSLNVLEISCATLMSPILGEAESALRSAAERARAAAPCVLLLDELDSIASSRAASGEGGVLYAPFPLII
eukprot:COSAG01_NODE_5676_length_4104_cov_40.338158_1_plen_399_part_00